MQKTLLLLITLSLAACQQATDKEETATATTFPKGQWIDLTHNFDEQTIFWPTAESFHLDTVFVGTTENGFYYEAFQFCLAEHGGTHLDAPVHFAEGKWSVEEIPVEKGIGEVVLIDVSERALQDRDYQINIEDVTNWEQEHGQIPKDALVFFRTGYGQYWPDKEQYMGTAERGPEAVAKLHFPGIHPDLAQWFPENRTIKAVGLDTPSIDYGQSTLFESHRFLYKHNILGFENLANLEQLPPTGAFVVALPMKIKGGSGGPLRAVALVP